jgi:hypothetical protein
MTQISFDYRQFTALEITYWAGTTHAKCSLLCTHVRSINTYMSQKVKKMVYYAYFHSAMSYGIIFSEISTDSTKIFKIQKRPIGIITGSKNR